jgi:hypothetical protein
MSNTLTTFMNTVANRFTESVSFTLKPHAAFLSAITINPTPETMPPNKKVVVNLLSLSGGGVNALTDAPAYRDVTTTGTELELNDYYSLPFQFSEVEMMQMISYPDLFDKTLQEIAMDVLSYANAKAAAKFVIANYDTAGNTSRQVVNTAGADVTLNELGALRTVLSTRKVPINDRGNLFIITHPIIYGKWVTSDDFAKASSLGDVWASTLRDNGELRPQFNFLPLEDPQVTVSGTSPNFTYSTAMFHRSAQIMVTAPLPKPVDGTQSFNIMVPTGTPGGFIPVRITAQHKQGIGATGGSSTSFLAEAFMGFHVHRKPMCAIHRTILAAS